MAKLQPSKLAMRVRFPSPAFPDTLEIAQIHPGPIDTFPVQLRWRVLAFAHLEHRIGIDERAIGAAVVKHRRVRRTCRECGNDVSRRATRCPRCGALFPCKPTWPVLLFAMLIILVSVGFVAQVVNYLIDNGPGQ